MDDPIEVARVKMDQLFRRANDLRETAPKDGDFLETFSQILEELEVAGEELRLQNEELMAARLEIEQERERYQGLFAFAPDAYLVTNTRGIIQEANQAACQMLNVPYRNLIRKPLTVFLEKDHLDAFHRALARPKSKHSLELRLNPRKKAPLDVAVTLGTIYDAQGHPEQLRWMLRDISERKAMYAALHQSEQRFRAIFQEASMGILLITPEGSIARANPAFLRMVGYSEEELTGQAMERLLQEDDNEVARELVRKLFHHEREQGSLRLRCRRKDGQRAWAEAALSLLHDEQQNTQFVLCITEDITAKIAFQEELEEMRRRLLESGEVERVRLAQELHDGPMQDLYGVVFHLADFSAQNKAAEDPQVKMTIEEVSDTMKRVAGTLRAICGELRPPTIGNLGLERAIRSHADGIQSRYPEMQLELKMNNDGQMLEPHARMAFFRIYQQCMNNVIRHAQATQVVVSFSINDEDITLDVWDNGRGFSMPNKWVDLLREGHYGLAGIAERVDALGGKLKIQTNPGAGTSVHVTVPRSPISLENNG